MAFRLQKFPCQKSLECQMGLHDWKTLVLGGRPLLMCRHCGVQIFKEVQEHTYKVGTEPKLFRPHIDLMEARREMLRKRIIESIDPKDRIGTRR